jgi:hypothetical protein
MYHIRRFTDWCIIAGSICELQALVALPTTEGAVNRVIDSGWTSQDIHSARCSPCLLRNSARTASSHVK